MEVDEILQKIRSSFDGVLDHFKDELAKIRTGRANAVILDKVMVEAYGVSIPLKQLANVTAPEAQLIQITPFDVSNIATISTAIRDDQNLDLNPLDDGKVVRINIPALTTERRELIVKQIGEKIEDAMIAIRNYRHESLKEAEQAKKNKQLTEDDYKSLQKQIDGLVNKERGVIDDIAQAKKQEVMSF